MLPTGTKEICVHIRWMIRRDMPEVLEIENRSFEFSWDQDEFLRCIRQRNVSSPMVAEHEECVVGFMIYELHKNRLHVLNFAVSPDFRRRGVGRAMLEKLKNKLSTQLCNRIVLEVRETNLGAQLFFREMGFRAVGPPLRHFYDETDEDAYMMQYLLPRNQRSLGQEVAIHA